ncbi:uncharacterized protein LOC122292165 [Carya illinoinensis]|uniref:Uncharacterized protein n=1 Tax=Carya illinoinensis TaxID=32201 RepID=A0A8T1NLD0_CARIL|nr:uncharacterized protein LOC122292165 [Carya illinoinensis]KAG6630581.1 hypothetical protein CIPAW_13G029000 [Carya illinoinensis]
MDAGPSSNIVAHITERILFRRMIDIGLNPEESMKVMAFWMWLEAQSFKELVRKISSNNDKFLALITDEAKAVLSILDSGSTAPVLNNLCPITSIFSPFSIHEIFGDKESVSKGVTDVYNRVCCVIFKDLLEERGSKVRTSDEECGRAGDEKAVTRRVRQFGEGTSRKVAVLDLVEAFPDGVEKTWLPSSLGMSEGEGDAESVRFKLNPFAKEWNPAIERAPEEERCLFLTFSKGHALTGNQITNFFNRKYGQCVERVYVHSPAHFGKVVFETRSIPAIVMGKLEQAKFNVDSKPLWCKWFDPMKKGLAAKK